MITISIGIVKTGRIYMQDFRGGTIGKGLASYAHKVSRSVKIILDN